MQFDVAVLVYTKLGCVHWSDISKDVQAVQHKSADQMERLTAREQNGSDQLQVHKCERATPTGMSQPSKKMVSCIRDHSVHDPPRHSALRKQTVGDTACSTQIHTLSARIHW
jgi:hypothetical protein